MKQNTIYYIIGRYYALLGTNDDLHIPTYISEIHHAADKTKLSNIAELVYAA